MRVQAGGIHPQKRAVHVEEGGFACQNGRVVTRGAALHDARPVAVHLDIRPRLTLPAEPLARAPGKKRWRLPPLALPAVGYWLAMGAVTYGFTRLGPHPLEPDPEPHGAAQGSSRPAAEPQITPVLDPAPARLASELEAPLTQVAAPSAPEVASEAPPEREPATEHRENRKPARREAFLGPSKDEPDVPREPGEPREPREPERVVTSFPELTDSSRPLPREHAADGPRIDSLFEPAGERPAKDAAPDAPAPPESAPVTPTVSASCEAAIARNNEQLTIGAARGPADITREAYAGILQNGRYLVGCSVPDRTVFEICAAVKDGHAIGITIVSNPSTPALNACVRSAVARLKFPRNSRLDVTHTRFEAVKH